MLKMLCKALFVLHTCSALSGTTQRGRLAQAWLRVTENVAETAAWYEELFAVSTRTLENGDEAEVLFENDFALRLSKTAPSKPYAERAGIIGVGVEVSAECVDQLPGEIVQLTVAASLYPDEDPSNQATLRYARLEDPAGYPVFGIIGDTAEKPAPKLVLCVSDLDQSIEFYTRCLGMRLLRKRALVPDLPAMTGIVGFTDADDTTLAKSPEGADPSATPRLELRYLYNNENVAANVGLAELHIACPDPDACAAMAELHGGTLKDDENLILHDPDGYAIRLFPLA